MAIADSPWYQMLLNAANLYSGVTNTGAAPGTAGTGAGTSTATNMNEAVANGLAQSPVQTPQVQAPQTLQAPQTPQAQIPQATGVEPTSTVPQAQTPITTPNSQTGTENSPVKEKSLWETIKQNLTGEGLEGEALKDWQQGMGIASMLGSLAHNIGGDNTWQGGLGKGLANFGKGAIAGVNAKQAEGALANALQNSAKATGGSAPLATAGATNSANYGRSGITEKESKLMDDVLRQLGTY